MSKFTTSLNTDTEIQYTDENCDLEEVPRMTYDDSVKYFFGVMNDDFYYKHNR